MIEYTERTQLCENFEKLVDDRYVFFLRQLESLIPQVLTGIDIEDYQISDEILIEVAYNAAKDIEKITLYQKNNVDEIKIAGYLGFWIRKLKPVQKAVRKADGRIEVAVNERVSIWLMAAILTRQSQRASRDKAQRSQIFNAFSALKKDNEKLKYLLHSMRYRTFGPHNYVVWLRELFHI